MDHLAGRLEALLFATGESIRIDRAAKILGVPRETLLDTAASLEAQLMQRGGGIVLVRTDETVALATAPGHTDLIASLEKDSLSREIGQAGLEVLGILIYKGPSTRARIDYIRGVNSSSTVRNLLARELIERVKSSEDSREYLYRPTLPLLTHMGVASVEGVPEYASIRESLDRFEAHAQPTKQPDQGRP